jgi:2-oxoisovalerate dehydrogenase E1 component
VQDNQWSISASADEFRAMNAFEYAEGFKGMKRFQCDGSDFLRSYETMEMAIEYVRTERMPVLVHAKVPLLGHHTSGVRKEFYRTREDLLRHGLYDPLPKLRLLLTGSGVNEFEMNDIEAQVDREITEAFANAQLASDPDVESISDHIYAPTPATQEVGIREPWNGEKVMMVDAALHAIEEIMREYPESIFYGQDVGKRLGGVFREAATLAEKFGDNRVFNTAIQEAYIVGSTAGLSAVGIKPIVEVQFGDYIYPAINQLVNEISRSNYLTNGKFPIQMCFECQLALMMVVDHTTVEV